MQADKNITAQGEGRTGASLLTAIPNRWLTRLFGCRHRHMSPFYRGRRNISLLHEMRRAPSVRRGAGQDDGGLLLRSNFRPLRAPNTERTPEGRKVNMATDNLLGTTVRIRRGRHGGRTGEVVAFDHRDGPSSYTVIKVQLKGNSQPVVLYSLDELETLSDPPSVSPLPATPPELPKVI